MTCIILPDIVLERHVIVYADGGRVYCKSFYEAVAHVWYFNRTLREVPINSREGQKILKRIGADSSSVL